MPGYKLNIVPINCAVLEVIYYILNLLAVLAIYFIIIKISADTVLSYKLNIAPNSVPLR